MKSCSVDGCDKPAVTRGYCTGHYQRWTRGDPVDVPLRLHRRVRECGTVSKYTAGCRCDRCREAKRLYTVYYRAGRTPPPIEVPEQNDVRCCCGCGQTWARDRDGARKAAAHFAEVSRG